MVLQYQKMFRLIIVFSLFFCTLTNCAPRSKGLSGLNIIGGQNAKIGLCPYNLNLKNLGIHTCGAALIAENVALTAAHCTHGQSAFSLSVSANTLTLKDKGVWIRVERVEEHPKYKKETYDFDISLLFLRQSFQLGRTIAKIALPNADFVIPEGSLATVSGWGVYNKAKGGVKGAFSEDLKFVNVPIWKQSNCFYYSHHLKSSVFCAGITTGKKNACAGDSGGPLVYKSKLIGLVSFGYGCGVENKPVVYTNVASHRDWIAEKTGL